MREPRVPPTHPLRIVNTVLEPNLDIRSIGLTDPFTKVFQSLSLDGPSITNFAARSMTCVAWKSHE